MKNSYFHKNLLQLSKVDRLKFIEYVDSPYFNKRESLRRILKSIYELIENGAKNNPTKKAFWKQCFPDKEWKEQTLKDALSDLMRLLEQFLAQQRFEQEQADFFTLEAMNQRGMHHSFERYWKKAQKKEQKRLTPKSSHQHHNQFLIQDTLDRHYMQRGQRTYTEGLQKKLDHLELFYMLEKLECCCNMLNRMNVLKSNYNSRFLDATLQILTSNWDFYQQNKLIHIYYQIVQTLRDTEADKAFQTLKSLLFEHVNTLDQQQGSDILSYARNYCTRQLNAGKTVFLQELFDLYKLSLEHGFLLEHGLISQFAYKNIVTAACRLKQFNWATEFIHTYKKHLEKDIQNNAFNYNLASLYYSQGNYGEATTLLQTIEYTDVYYNTDARVMLLKIYFDQGETRAFLSQCDSFNIFLLRNKNLSNYQNKSYRNLIRITKKMILLKEKKNLLTKAAFDLQKEDMNSRINQTRPIANLQWVTEKWTIIYTA